MTDLSALSRVVRTARRDAAPVRRGDDRSRLPVRIAEREATVALLPGRFRHAEYISRHVAFVAGLDAERGEQHILRNLDAIRLRMLEIGIGKRDADRELRLIESAVRRELWRQVLLP